MIQTELWFIQMAPVFPMANAGPRLELVYIGQMEIPGTVLLGKLIWILV
jgi:hypothetical protein